MTFEQFDFRQPLKCSHCHKPINKERGWHETFVEYRNAAGDIDASREPFHLTCLRKFEMIRRLRSR